MSSILVHRCPEFPIESPFEYVFVHADCARCPYNGGMYRGEHICQLEEAENSKKAGGKDA